MSLLPSLYFWGTRVLVVESDRALRETVVEGLASRGFLVFGAESSGEALSFIDQEMDAVVFELSMFDRGGRDLIDEWKRRKGKTQIIVCGFEPNHLLTEIITRGAHISPFGLAHVGWLVDTIRRHLNTAPADLGQKAKSLSPPYTLESAKALMEQGKQEHEKGKLTWAAEAWKIAEKKWREKHLQAMNRRYRKSR